MANTFVSSCTGAVSRRSRRVWQLCMAREIQTHWTHRYTEWHKWTNSCPRTNERLIFGRMDLHHNSRISVELWTFDGNVSISFPLCHDTCLHIPLEHSHAFKYSEITKLWRYWRTYISFEIKSKRASHIPTASLYAIWYHIHIYTQLSRVHVCASSVQTCACIAQVSKWRPLLCITNDARDALSYIWRSYVSDQPEAVLSFSTADTHTYTRISVVLAPVMWQHTHTTQHIVRRLFACLKIERRRHPQQRIG